MATPTEKTTPILHDLWAERASSFREKEYRVAEKVMVHAEQMTEDQLLAKAQSVETFAKMGRRSTGLDKEDGNKNAVNIAILGDFDASYSTPSFYKSNRVASPIDSTLGNGQDSGIVEASTE